MNILRIILFFLFLAAGIACIKYRVIWVVNEGRMPRIISTAPPMYTCFALALLMMVLIFRHNARRVRRQREMVDEIGRE